MCCYLEPSAPVLMHVSGMTLQRSCRQESPAVWRGVIKYLSVRLFVLQPLACAACLSGSNTGSMPPVTFPCACYCIIFVLGPSGVSWHDSPTAGHPFCSSCMVSGHVCWLHVSAHMLDLHCQLGVLLTFFWHGIRGRLMPGLPPGHFAL